MNLDARVPGQNRADRRLSACQEIGAFSLVHNGVDTLSRPADWRSCGNTVVTKSWAQQACAHSRSRRLILMIRCIGLRQSIRAYAADRAALIPSPQSSGGLLVLQSDCAPLSLGTSRETPALTFRF